MIDNPEVLAYQAKRLGKTIEEILDLLDRREGEACQFVVIKHSVSEAGLTFSWDTPMPLRSPEERSLALQRLANASQASSPIYEVRMRPVRFYQFMADYTVPPKAEKTERVLESGLGWLRPE